MERPSYDELISAYFDDETTPEENVVVERLLADPKYRQALEEYRQLRDELRSMPAPRLDSDWSARLKQRLVTAKPDWAAKSVAASAPVVSTEGDVASDGRSSGQAVGGPMPASLDASRGDGYSRYRHLWLTAGVGVAAGTLGIVIGWSAQNLTPGEVAYYDGATTTASPAPANDPLPMAIEAGNGEVGDTLRKKAESEFAFDTGQYDLPQTAEAAQDFATAPFGGAAPTGGATFSDQAGAMDDRAMFGSELGERAGIVDAPQASRSEAVREMETPALGADKLVANDAVEQKKSEKQDSLRGSAIAGTPLRTDPSASGSSEGEGLARESTGSPGVATYYATYFGVWDADDDGLSSNRTRGVAKQMNGAVDRARRNAELADMSTAVDSLQADDAPALVLEGSPERVAEALEVLSRDRSNGEVRLLQRKADSNVLAYEQRARGLYVRTSSVDEPLAAAEPKAERSVESALDVRGDGENEERGDRDRKLLASQAFDTKESASSAIDRIESFYLESTKEKSSIAGIAPSDEALANDVLAGGFGYSGGGSGRSGIGGFGGLGGGSFPFAPAAGPQPALMPDLADSASAAPVADADAAPEEGPSIQSGGAPMAAAPAASPAPGTAVEQAQGAVPPAEPADTPTTGPDRPRSQAEGVAGATPPPMRAMSREPAPPAPAPAAALAEGAAPPPLPEAAEPSAETDSEEVDGSVGKLNRFAEGSGSGAMRMSRGALREGAAAAPADQPAPKTSPGAGGRAQASGEARLALESLQEETEASGIQDRSWMARDFAPPAPERVRVILFASERPLLRSLGTGVPAGPAATASPALPAAPTTAPPSVEATPAESAPESDR